MPRLGSDMAEWSDVRYARTRDGLHLAYQEAGQGPDLLLFLEGFVPIDAMDEEPHLSGALRRMAEFSHVIRFNRRGVGLSDRPGPDAPPTLEQWLDDAEAVLDAVGCHDVIAFGDTGGALIATGFAALRPHRVRSLVLVNGYAKFFAGPDHPAGGGGASPGLAWALRHVIEHLDLRDLLPTIDVPTLVLHRVDAQALDVEQG